MTGPEYLPVTPKIPEDAHLERVMMAKVSVSDWEALGKRVERLERAAEALRSVVEDVRQLDGTCPHATWVEARDALAALDQAAPPGSNLDSKMNPAPAPLSREERYREALDEINMMACYASEENTDSREGMLLRIGEAARAALDQGGAP